MDNKENPPVVGTSGGREDITFTDNSIPFFAQNVNVKVCVDTIPYIKKPTATEIGGISKRTKCPEQVRELTPAQLLNDYLRKGYTVSQSETSVGKREDFVSQQVFYSNIDNDNQGQETPVSKKSPNGVIEDCETPYEAAKRELYEESGAIHQRAGAAATPVVI